MSVITPTKSIAKKVRKARLDIGLTQVQLAEQRGTVIDSYGDGDLSFYLYTWGRTPLTGKVEA